MRYSFACESPFSVIDQKGDTMAGSRNGQSLQAMLNAPLVPLRKEKKMPQTRFGDPSSKNRGVRPSVSWQSNERTTPSRGVRRCESLPIDARSHHSAETKSSKRSTTPAWSSEEYLESLTDLNCNLEELPSDGDWTESSSEDPLFVSLRPEEACQDDVSIFSDIYGLSEFKSESGKKRSSLGTARTSIDSTLSMDSLFDKQALTKRENTVGFDKIVVREYSQIIGHNPACSPGGPSLSIGWEYTEHPPLPVEAFEKIRRDHRNRSRDLKITPEERKAKALRLGYTKKQIADAVRQLNVDRNLRRQTGHNMGNELVVIAVAGAADKVKNLLKFRRSASFA